MGGLEGKGLFESDIGEDVEGESPDVFVGVFDALGGSLRPALEHVSCLSDRFFPG